jgi:hypothetical protein
MTDDLEITGSVDPTAYCKAPAEAIDEDSDGTNEIDIDSTEKTALYDFDDDGTTDHIMGKDLNWFSYDCMGDSVPAQYTSVGTQLRHGEQNCWGLCRGYTTAAANSDFQGGFQYGGGMNSAAYDPQQMRVFETRVASEQATDYIMVVGMLKGITTNDIDTIQRGVYFICATAGHDIDGSGAAGSTEDLKWWAVAQNNDTDHTGDICSGTSGTPPQCSGYTAVNTEAWNTDVSCDDVDQFWELKIVCNAAGSSCEMWLDGTLEVTFSTQIPTAALNGAGYWLETQAAAIKYMQIDYIKVAHDF